MLTDFDEKTTLGKDIRTWAKKHKREVGTAPSSEKPAKAITLRFTKTETSKMHVHLHGYESSRFHCKHLSQNIVTFLPVLAGRVHRDDVPEGLPHGSAICQSHPASLQIPHWYVSSVQCRLHLLRSGVTVHSVTKLFLKSRTSVSSAPWFAQVCECILHRFPFWRKPVCFFVMRSSGAGAFHFL